MTQAYDATPRYQTALGTAATLSGDGAYRYTLTRLNLLSGELFARPVAFVMLNPSTADAYEDDATIRRCVGYARAWNMRPLIVVNLFALRSTDPRALKRHPNPVGPDNDAWVRAVARGVHEAGGTIVAAWGTHGSLNMRDAFVVEHLLEGLPIHVLALTKGGDPHHPLRLSASLRPQLWTPGVLPRAEVRHAAR